MVILLIYNQSWEQEKRKKEKKSINAVLNACLKIKQDHKHQALGESFSRRFPSQIIFFLIL